MNCKALLCLISCIIFAFLVKALKLNRQRPSTIWGIQKKLLQQELKKDYFSSWDGVYQFEYDTGNTEHQIFRKEKRYPDGTVVGFFGYIDSEGILRITEYLAGRFGYKQRTILRHPVLFNHR